MGNTGKDDTELTCTAKVTGGKPCGLKARPGSTRCGKHQFKVPGRPSKMTPTLQEEIVDALLDGAYLETAAAAAGIDDSTLWRWVKRGTEATADALNACDDAGIEDPDMGNIYEYSDPADWPYIDFCRATKAASAFAEIELLRRIVRGKGQAWQRFMTVLERRHQQRWRLRPDEDAFADKEAGKAKKHGPTDNEKREQVIGLMRGAVDLETIYPNKAEAAKLNARPKRKQAQARKRASAAGKKPATRKPAAKKPPPKRKPPGK